MLEPCPVPLAQMRRDDQIEPGAKRPCARKSKKPLRAVIPEGDRARAIDRDDDVARMLLQDAVERSRIHRHGLNPLRLSGSLRVNAARVAASVDRRNSPGLAAASRP